MHPTHPNPAKQAAFMAPPAASVGNTVHANLAQPALAPSVQAHGGGKVVPGHTAAGQGGAPAQPPQGVAPYQPPSPALRAVFAARAAQVPLTRQDLPPALLESVPHCWAAAQAASQPVTELHVAAWLKKLGPLVTNPPGPATAAAQCRAIYEVCADIPCGAWGHAARLAWVRQPPRQGYPVGARWPSPNELRTHLQPFANAIAQDVAGCKALMALRPLQEH
ncbi:hypothetical protein [Acetobacter orientalis]|uniref:hypothetical protein n=1 Tax=Acetobacter orientalis TaxID=146474 RepID=UPI00241BF9DA|nr:hypothetical protein [Acetobacter orientalis]